MNSPSITTATPADRDRVVATIVAAFAADPAFRYFFPDEATYHEYASAFAGYLFDKRVHGPTVWLAEGGAAVALWDPPSPKPYDGSTLDFPADVTARLDAYEAAVHPLLPTEPHWYLGVLATHPDHAGRRWGRAVMAAGVARAREDGVPAYLETTNARNVEVYRGAGWEVTGSVTTMDLPIWVMRTG